MHIYWKDPESGVEIIKKGVFFISESNKKYRILNRIPRFVDEKNYTNAFGIQWNHFRKTQLDSYSKFPLSEQRLKRCLGRENFSNLKDKSVLEAGCGAGRFTEILLNNNANVVSIDMSNAVEANQENFPQNEHHVIAQADICKLPFIEEQFDIVLCLGVIQHTKHPEQTLKALYEQVKPGGWLIVDHYIFSWSYATQIAKIVSRFVLKRINPEKSFLITGFLVKVFLPLHKLGKRSRIWQAIMRRVTPVVSYYNDFPKLSDELQEEWALLDTYDNLTDHYKHFTTHDKLEHSMHGLGMQNVKCWSAGIGVECRGMKPVNITNTTNV
jgi:2-polyprenyl-3-methyl-5-hydroxy-6-metoxy-1,4-benzoquinol methylase